MEAAVPNSRASRSQLRVSGFRSRSWFRRCWRVFSRRISSFKYLVNALPTQAIVDVGGVGYEVFIPLSSYDKLPAMGQSIRILTHLAVREDAHVLYGFMTPAERDLFRLLVNNVSGIGPKLALAVLSGMSVNNFKAAVVNSDVAAISKISGLGKKTAERIVLELKDKLGVAAAWEAASAAHAPTPEAEQANE